MEKKIYELSLFIFRRDLRLIDNTSLNIASKLSKQIIPAFFLDERQINKTNNKYFSSNCVQFMLESIIDLNTNLTEKNSNLILLYGNLIDNLDLFIKKNKENKIKINSIFLNKDYTPFSIIRDNEIKNLCEKHEIDFYSNEDLMLVNMNDLKLNDDEFFKVFTHYYKKVINLEIRKPEINYLPDNFFKKKDIKFIDDNLFDNNEKIITEYDLNKLISLLNIEYNNNISIKGGRKNALDILKNIKKFENYAKDRNLVNLPTTNLSAYLKFGCISIRELYLAIEENIGNGNYKNHDLTKHLHVRDFFMKIAYFNPKVYTNNFKEDLDSIIWQGKESHIQAWKEGNTGFPLVDAAMRCLNSTGYIHNKLRNLTCAFLTKDILANWRIGEEYFATKLVDYDISLNNGGWQWTSSTGTDPKNGPRIYNPNYQSEKLDPDCEYIFKWIPELKIKNVQIKHIHNWEKFYMEYPDIEYPNPIFSHDEQVEKAYKMYQGNSETSN
jgi:deoxyribodipyrimidine photo-lyase